MSNSWRPAGTFMPWITMTIYHLTILSMTSSRTPQLFWIPPGVRTLPSLNRIRRAFGGGCSFRTTLRSPFTIAPPTAPPARLITFLDVHENEILDTEFGIPTQGVWGYGSSWWDLPANRHNQGCNFSFADGHAEHWKWKVPKIVTVPRGSIQSVAPGESDDYSRVQSGIKQTLGP